MNFWVSPFEKEMIDKKMEQLHVKNLSAYLRKVAIDGYILNLDMEPIKELVVALRQNGNNLNQIAKQTNEQGIYEDDIQELQRRQTEIWEMFSKILKALRKA